MSKQMAFVDGGTYYHHATLTDPRFKDYFDRVIYAPDLVTEDWSDVDILFVASRQDSQHLVAVKDKIIDFLAAGKTVVALGESRSERWLPNISWHPREVNFWWWLTPGEDSKLRVVDQDYALWQHLDLSAATWHQHGYFDVPEGAVSVIEHADGGTIFYDDQVSTNGRMILTTLDPCYHHGSYFMPSTTEFLKGFLPWLKA